MTHTLLIVNPEYNYNNKTLKNSAPGFKTLVLTTYAWVLLSMIRAKMCCFLLLRVWNPNLYLDIMCDNHWFWSGVGYKHLCSLKQIYNSWAWNWEWFFTIFVAWAQLFKGRLALNPGLNLTLVSFSQIIFSVILRASNHQLIDKKN